MGQAFFNGKPCRRGEHIHSLKAVLPVHHDCHWQPGSAVKTWQTLASPVVFRNPTSFYGQTNGMIGKSRSLKKDLRMKKYRDMLKYI